MRTLLVVGALLASSAANAQTLEADNGAQFRILKTYLVDNRWRGSDKLFATAEVANDDGRFMSLTFDCEGMFTESSGVHWRRVPSRSVLAKIQQISCKKITR